MKYSLIIVSYGAEAALVRCLESLDANTPEGNINDAEIILVDNSPEPIQGCVTNDLLLRLCNKYLRVLFLWNDGKNPGFASACNQGVLESHGKNIVLINPDTIVFPEWAERMESYLKLDKVGAVGPISNFVAGFQNYGIHMQPCKDWETTAKTAIRGLNHRGVDSKLLIGFFLMMRRKIWDEMGGMDSSLVLGCDDLDLSLRLTEAGYKLVIASDVFVYHEGHVSMRETGSKAEEMVKQSESAMMKKLEAKYPDGIPSSTELWGCEILPTHSTKPMTLSICMIVRDDCENMDKILPQLRFADQIIIAETEPDAVRAMTAAQGYLGYMRKNDSVHFFPWADNFADARNYALSKCTGDYVLWLDADDRVPELSGKLIRAALDNPGPLTAQKKVHFTFKLHDHSPQGIGIYAHPRMFPRIPGMEWEGRIHECYANAAERLKLKCCMTDIIVEHYGYMDKDVKEAKNHRNLRLLHMEPEGPYKHYHIAKSYNALGQFAKARKTLKGYFLSLNNLFKDQQLFDEYRYMIALTYYMEQSRGNDAMEPWLIGNTKADSIFLMAEVLIFRDEYQQAYELYNEYLQKGNMMDTFGSEWNSFSTAAHDRIMRIDESRAKALELMKAVEVG